jgi:hypothetical protein
MKQFALLMIVTGLCACSSMDYTGGKYPPTSPSSVEVVTLSQLHRPYEIVGEYTGNPVLQNMMDWKKKAAGMGANAISIPEMLPNRYVKLYAIRWK